MREHVSRKKQTTTGFSIPSLKHPTRGFGLESSVISRQAIPEVQPINKPVTHDISRIPLRNPQAKLSISQPGDKYEQEADSVAQQVMQRMAQRVNRQSIQREALPEEEELQMKPLANSITPLVQREALPEDEEELQMKPLDNSTLQREALPEDEEELQMKPMVQRQGEAGMAAAPDLEASINQARGGGQLIADNIREPMEQAFGANFSGVKVHTDDQSDQLNRSIQARAFTTGQDVFFRQGEYNPGSRGGQELLAHELTHVVQQNGGAVQRSLLPPQQLPQYPTIKTKLSSVGDCVSQGSVGVRTIQLKWIWNGNKWNSDAGDAENTRPTIKGKRKGDVFDPTPTVEASGSKGVAEKHKEEKIQPYLNLLNHLGGEIKDKKNVSGGHLLTAMRKNWGKRLEIDGTPNQTGVWTCNWTIDARSMKSSTMFPSQWTTADLEKELMASTSVGNKITLKSGIPIEKKGGTFYPLLE